MTILCVSNGEVSDVVSNMINEIYESESSIIGKLRRDDEEVAMQSPPADKD